jgi:hypothetical protein
LAGWDFDPLAIANEKFTFIIINGASMNWKVAGVIGGDGVAAVQLRLRQP